ncbi:phosphate signaling complex protein PhoU [Saccharibacter floricola]|uniref:Phosphate-specific transport system accessory protein PhoU n=1 Tax=Saccharibacter floricola DSM 15669 TaxID=1123227 RepID=A0ABQ0NXY7_9PROT|nr:phosphate signaling complex protein PhoU [Saccharibacter floricola]GBQ06175.1 transcriptional regulator for phosphate uptake PhoU [Saccharibacter floricola DSM 15669]
MPDRSRIATRYEQELVHLRAMMARMGGIVEYQLTLALSALVDGDTEATDNVLTYERHVDGLAQTIEAHVIRLLALRAPMANDLREVVATMKIAGDLERIGDYATSMALRAADIRKEGYGLSFAVFQRMGLLVQDHLRRSLDALLQKDLHAALEVWHADTTVDAYYMTLFRDVMGSMVEDPRKIRACTSLLFIVKNLECIGDHATNIAERAFFVVKGETIPAPAQHKVALKSHGGEV